MSDRRAVRRAVRFTLLAVGEGAAEEAFLRHLKTVYGDDLGRFVHVRNAKGKGAHHVLAYAIRCQQSVPHDKAVIWIDNDAHWNAADRKKALTKKILVVESEPCMEAVLLGICGVFIDGGTTAEHKRRFEEHFGAPAHEVNFEQHFGRDALDRARGAVPQLAALLNHLGVPAKPRTK